MYLYHIISIEIEYLIKKGQIKRIERSPFTFL